MKWNFTAGGQAFEFEFEDYSFASIKTAFELAYPEWEINMPRLTGTMADWLADGYVLTRRHPLDKIMRKPAAPVAERMTAQTQEALIALGLEMVRITTTVRDFDEWPVIPALWLECMRERDEARAALSAKAGEPAAPVAERRGAPMSQINYTKLFEFAERNRIDYNMLCAAVREAIAPIATHSCPWCGSRVPESDDCPQPPDVCHHEVVITDQAAKE